jgi:two-component sensor histidine kinase
MNSLRCVLTLLFLFTIAFSSIAAKPLKPTTEQQVAFKEALLLIEAYSNDSANVVLSGLMEELKQAGDLDTEFGLRVQMRRAEVLEKDDQDEIAFDILQDIKSKSKANGYWEIYAHAHIILARMHEKFRRWAKCKENLDTARAVIQKYDLDQLSARLYMRASSYYRFNDQLDSALICAKLAATIAPRYGQMEYASTAQLLLGHLQRPDVVVARNHYEKAAMGYQQIGNHSHHTLAFLSLARLSIAEKDYEQALAYSDAALVAADLAQKQGHDGNYFFPAAYEQRAAVFKQFEQLDSAIHYLVLSHHYKLEQEANNNENRLMALEARYDGEKKAQQLEEQAKEIAYEKNRRNGLIALFAIVSIFAAILVRLYLRLKAANEKMRQQSQTIQQTNHELQQALEQQIMLQGEIHHRVKNNLQVIISLLDLQRDDIQDAKALESLEAMSNRIYSMAAIHEVLYQKEGEGRVSFYEYVDNLCRHFHALAPKQNQPIFHLEIEHCLLTLETLMPLGIIMNELMTNSLKYAVVPNQPLEISVDLQVCADGYCLSYRDNGPGFKEGGLMEREGGLGSYLLKSMCRQLQGDLKSYNDDGAVHEVFFKQKNSHTLNGVAYSYN